MHEHAPFLTGTGVDNIARTMGLITLMGQVTPQVADKFRTGGGLAYADYPGFHDAQAADSAAVNDASLIDTIVPLTGLVDRLREGIDVADIGCGEGHAINLLAREFPASRFWGFDFSAEALEPARAEAAAWGLTNATSSSATSRARWRTEAYDLVTAFDAIHDQAHPGAGAGQHPRSLRPGGTFLMVDIKASSQLENNLDLPWASFLYAVSTVHCMSVSLGQGGDGLGTVWGTELADPDAPGRRVHRRSTQHELEQDPFNAYFVSPALRVTRSRADGGGSVRQHHEQHRQVVGGQPPGAALADHLPPGAPVELDGRGGLLHDVEHRRPARLADRRHRRGQQRLAHARDPARCGRRTGPPRRRAPRAAGRAGGPQVGLQPRLHPRHSHVADHAAVELGDPGRVLVGPGDEVLHRERQRPVLRVARVRPLRGQHVGKRGDVLRAPLTDDDLTHAANSRSPVEGAHESG